MAYEQYGERPRRIVGSNIRAAEAVTPADGSDLPLVATYGPACAVYVGTSGSVIITSGGVDLTFANVAAGVWHPMPPFTRVKTGSGAQNIIAGY